MRINGILNVIKPGGKTSFEIVALIRKWSGERRVGHAGTLDPEATGVLPVCLGEGTRIVEFLMADRKSYRAQAQLGVATDTYDSSGKAIWEGDFSTLTRGQVEAALNAFRGTIEQTPPMYSAVKHQGKPLYRLARAGIEVPREAKKIDIFSLEVTDWQPPVIILEIECSKGTYIRSLVHDLGQALGCGAHLKNLVRLQSGLFHIEDGASVSQVEDAFRCGRWPELIYPIDAVLVHLKAAIVDEESERAIRNGRPVPGPGAEDNAERCRAYSLDGRFVALLHREPGEGYWHPEKVFSGAG